MASTSGASDDPFEHFLKPPADETVTDRRERLKREADAKAVNEAINAQLRKEGAQMKKRAVKILLLGQAESGKSTTLKNFRLMFAKTDWDAERASWRAVIHLNIIRSIITIVNTIQAELDGDPIRPLYTLEEARPNSPTTTEPNSPDVDEESPIHLIPSPSFEKHSRLKAHLPALKRSYRELQTRLGEGAYEEFDDDVPGPPSGASKSAGEGRQSLSRNEARAEFCVRRLQEALASAEQASRAETDMPTEVLLESLDDILAVWKDKASQAILKKRHVRLQEMVPAFLSDLARIVQRTYIPTDNDVIRSRLRTVGVQEYRINVDGSSGSVGVNQGRDWLIYDVGGSRTMRQAWVPYFDDVQAIIFLAPISCFDERLAEDSSVNRLEDSFILWRQICSSRLLSNASLILFLNKCDLLGKKLKAGARVEKFLPSFGGRSNDLNTVVKYLREKFRVSSKDHSPITRACYIYPTIVIDTAATAATVSAVKDSILRDYLRFVDLV